MAHYENVGEPTLQTHQVYWFSAEQATKNGWMRRGSVLDKTGKVEIAKLIEFNGPERQSGELKGMFQCVEVTPDKGEPFTQYQFLG